MRVRLSDENNELTVVNLGVNEIAEILKQNIAVEMLPAVTERVSNETEKVNFICQQLYFLEFNSSIDKVQISARANEYQIPYVFEFNTNDDQDNFYLAFEISNNITSLKMRNLIQNILMGIFPECTRNCYGVEKSYTGLITKSHYSNNAMSLQWFLAAHGGFMVGRWKSKYKVKLQEFYNENKIHYDVNLRPLFSMDVYYDEEFCAKSQVFYYISNATLEFRTTSIFPVITERDQLGGLVFIPEGIEKPGPSHTYNGPNVLDKYRGGKYNWDMLEGSCKLYREFIVGQISDPETQLKILTNLLKAEGGGKRFNQVVTLYHSQSTTFWKQMITYINKTHYQPSYCDGFCPYQEECRHFSCLIQMGKPTDCVYITDPKETISLKEAEERLAAALKHALAQKEDKVFVIKAPPGIGKTELYFKKNNVIIALPTHELKSKVLKRFQSQEGGASGEILSIDELDESIMDEVRHLYDIGAYSDAVSRIRELATDNPAAQLYIEKKQQAKTHEDILLVTHEALVFLDSPINTIIIDEDIFQTLLKPNTISIYDLQNANRLSNGILQDLLDTLPSDNATHQMTTIEKATILTVKDSIKESGMTSNILQFLQCDYFSVNNQFINFITRRFLSQKKIIILSATADRNIYQQLFGDRLEFMDIGHVASEGFVKQDISRSFSKSYFENINPKVLQKIQSFSQDMNLITHKKYECLFESSTTKHFGALRGMDEFKGKDVVIVGTYHLPPQIYSLFYSALYDEEILPRTDMAMRLIEYDHQRFYFYTYYEGTPLRDIQLYLISSELIQAVGRARSLREECWGYVFSRYPLYGVKHINLLDNEEVEILKWSRKEFGKIRYINDEKSRETLKVIRRIRDLE